MKYPTEIQAFLNRIHSPSEIESSERNEPDHEAGTFNLTLTRTIDQNARLTHTKIVRNTFNAEVPDTENTGQFASPQAFVDAVIAFIQDPDNNISVTDGVISNDRPEPIP